MGEIDRNSDFMELSQKQLERSLKDPPVNIEQIKGFKLYPFLTTLYDLYGEEGLREAMESGKNISINPYFGSSQLGLKTIWQESHQHAWQIPVVESEVVFQLLTDDEQVQLDWLPDREQTGLIDPAIFPYLHEQFKRLVGRKTVAFIAPYIYESLSENYGLNCVRRSDDYVYLNWVNRSERPKTRFFLDEKATWIWLRGRRIPPHLDQTSKDQPIGLFNTFNVSFSIEGIVKD